MFWDSLIGTHWLPLMGVRHSNHVGIFHGFIFLLFGHLKYTLFRILLNFFPFAKQEGAGKWLSLDSDLIMKNGEVIGTQTPTGHSVLIDVRFELPCG